MIRRARQDDAAALAVIYAPYVERTWISFEEVPPSAHDMRAKLLAGIQTYSWLIEEHNGEVRGYAYGGCIADAQLIAGRYI
jgi:phosphinothricin acetyltransferase